MERKRIKARPFGALGGLALLTLLGCAALHAARADDADPPARVARLSDVEGAVSLQPAGVAEWTAAQLNRPLTTGDKLWSDQNSRAEVDLGAAVIRLGNSTGFSFLNLDDSTAQMQVTAGTLIVHVRDLQQGQTDEIDTPNVAVTLEQPGDYRVEVSDSGDATTVKVSDGAAQAAGGGLTLEIGAQQRVTFTGASTLAYDSATLGAPDDLDNWSAARERQAETSASAEYVARDVPGAQDLDDNGRWEETPDYGYVWAPTVFAGWVPYRFGHWAWITPWGWTWIDEASWGFVPFHYGRWVQWQNSWCWVPGPRGMRPVYAPALVAWMGGPAVGASPAFGPNVGWFPLGPREVYVPAYAVSAAYVRRVNITNTTIVNTSSISSVDDDTSQRRHYLNGRLAAVTTVPRNIFTSGQRVGGHVVPLPAAALATAAVAATAPAIAPIRQSVLGPAEGRGVARPPAALMDRGATVRKVPPPAPVAFEKQLAAIEANGGHPLSRSRIAQLQPATPAVRVRLVTAGGPVVSVGTLAAKGTERPALRQPLPGGAASPNLAERERILQGSRLPPAPYASAGGPAAAAGPTPAARTTPAAAVAPAAHAASPARPGGDTLLPDAPAAAFTPQARSDRPPWTQPPQHSSATQPHELAVDDPTHAYAHPPPVPAYRPPAVTDTDARSYESPRTEPTQRAHPSAPPAAPVQRAPPAQRASTPQPPPRAQASPEPRDLAPHGDRESRERVLR